MRAAAFSSWLLGLALLAGLITYQGVGEVGSALALAGAGAALVLPAHAGVLLADTLGWRPLIAHRARPPLRRLLAMRWVGASVNGLLPVAQIGGEVVRARLLARAGVPGSLAGASVIVDLTLGLATQLCFAGLGLGLLLARQDSDAALADLALGMAAFALLLAALVLAQRRGPFLRLAHLLERAAGRRTWLQLAGGAAALDREIVACYRRRWRFVIGAAFRLLGWLWGSVELWLIFLLLGHPITAAEAIILESVVQAVRSAGFAIPGALGVQEGGLMLAGAWLGIGPDLALAAALIRRGRELLYGCGGLLAWPFLEARRAPQGGPTDRPAGVAAGAHPVGEHERTAGRAR